MVNEEPNEMVQTLKARMRARENLAGCFIMLPSPAVVEMAGDAGFDFVILDTDHGADTSETLEHQLRAADASGISALVRTNSINPGQDPSRARRWCRWHRFPACAYFCRCRGHCFRGTLSTLWMPRHRNHRPCRRHGFTSVAEHLSRAYGSTIMLP